MGICKPLGSMAQLAGQLGALLDRPVLDMTGLTGRYAYFLTWIADRGDGPRCSPAEPGCFNEPVRPQTGIFSAVREQLGLRLVPQKAPVDMLVIDRAEKPSAN
jgi:bla regulator protein blaR1